MDVLLRVASLDISFNTFGLPGGGRRSHLLHIRTIGGLRKQRDTVLIGFEQWIIQNMETQYSVAVVFYEIELQGV